MSLADNVISGFASAAGDTGTVNRIAGEQSDRRATQHEELEANTHSILDDVKRLQDRRSQLDPKSPTYQKDLADNDTALHDARLALTKMYHPDTNPGALAHLGSFIKSHLGKQLPQAQPKTPAEARQRLDMAGLDARAAGPGQSPPNPYAVKKQQITEAGGTPEQVQRGVFGDKDIPTKYQPQLTETTDAQGKKHYWRVPLEAGGAPEEVDFKGQTVTPKSQGKENRDDKYIAIEQKKKLGQALTPEEKAYGDAYDLYVKKTKIDPGVARAAAYGANRFIPVLDPSNPENVVLMRAGEAAAAHVNTPQSMAFQIDKAITRAFTSGQPAQTIGYFNTATSHLELLRETADALNNGNVQLVNKWGNAYATATGLPAPAEFDTVRAAVAGELSKTFKGTGATDQEVETIGSTINSAQSPAQLNGVIDYYLSLMKGKMGALQGQFEAGKQGKPNFPTTNATPGDVRAKAATAAGRGPSDAKSFSVNGETYDIPADKVAAFKKKYPDAKEQ